MILSTCVNSLMEEIAAEIDARAAVNEPRPSRETRAPGLSAGLLAPFSSTLVSAAVRRFAKMRNSKVFFSVNISRTMNVIRL